MFVFLTKYIHKTNCNETYHKEVSQHLLILGFILLYRL